jgi:hypothetical protein
MLAIGTNKLRNSKKTQRNNILMVKGAPSKETLMSDFTDSMRRETDGYLEKFIFELFDRVDDEHDKAKLELHRAYHQGEKDALRRVIAMMTGSNVDVINGTSVIAHVLRGEVKTREEKLEELLRWTVSHLAKSIPYADEDSEFDQCATCGNPDWDHKPECEQNIKLSEIKRLLWENGKS